jgi:hypothetical protein
MAVIGSSHRMKTQRPEAAQQRAAQRRDECSSLQATSPTARRRPYVFDDPTRAVALAEALDLQDEVDAGTMTAEEAYARSGLEDDAAYTLYTLHALPREQALEIIYDTLGRSNRLYEAAERQREEQEREMKTTPWIAIIAACLSLQIPRENT